MVKAFLRGTDTEVELIAVFDNTDMAIMLRSGVFSYYEDVNLQDVEIRLSAEECFKIAKNLLNYAMENHFALDECSLKNADAYIRMARYMLTRVRASQEAERFKGLLCG